MGAVNGYWQWDGQTTNSGKLLVMSLKLCLMRPHLAPGETSQRHRLSWKAPQDVARCRNKSSFNRGSVGNSLQRTFKLNMELLVTKKRKTKPIMISLEEISIVFLIKSGFFPKMSVT